MEFNARICSVKELFDKKVAYNLKKSLKRIGLLRLLFKKEKEDRDFIFRLNLKNKR